MLQLMCDVSLKTTVLKSFSVPIFDFRFSVGLHEIGM